MSFRAFVRLSDDKVFYAFQGEEHRLPSANWKQEFSMLPPSPITIQATWEPMTEMPYLDSIHTQYELDRQLTIEAQMARESKAYHEAIIN